MIHRNVPETVGPISPVAECSHEPSSETAPLSPLIPTVNASASSEHDARVPEGEEEADAQRPLTV